MISEQFKKAVDNKDEGLVRIMLKNSLVTDLSFTSFDEMLDYAEKSMPEIIEEHDGTVLLEKEKWTKSYSSELKVDLVDNFSKERIEHVKDVQTYLYKKNHRINISADQNFVNKKKELNNHSYESKTHYGNFSKEEIKPDKHSLVTLITTLGVAGASIIFGVLFNMTITTIALGAIVVSAIIGGITYFLVKK